MIDHPFHYGCAARLTMRKDLVREAAAVFDSPVGFTPAEFAKMQGRVTGSRRDAAPAFASDRPAVRAHTVVLGVDPSLRGTGWGVIRVERSGSIALGHGTVKCPSTWQRSRCLVKIADAIRMAIREHHPTVAVVEGLFFAQNLQTAIIMGEARGASMVGIAEAGLDIFEIAPRKVKLAVVGYGAAQKLAVARMVQRLLKLSETPSPDAADALALALAFAQETGRFGLGGPKRV